MRILPGAEMVGFWSKPHESQLTTRPFLMISQPLQRIGRHLAGWALLLLLAVNVIAAPPARQPAIRQIDAKRDRAALQRIEQVRQKLPEKYQHRNNFAWAAVKIAGVEKTEYFAHSGIQRQSDVSAEAWAGISVISLRCRKGRFTVLCVNHNDEIEGENCWPRHVDTECKILEDLAARIPLPVARGQVLLYTDLYPCASCRYVMEQFLAAFSNVTLQVLFREY